MANKAILTRPVYRVDVMAGTSPVQMTKQQALHIRQLSNGRQGGVFYITDDSPNNFGKKAVILISDSKSDVEAVPRFNCWEQWKNAKAVHRGMRVYVMPVKKALDAANNDVTGGYYFTAAGEMYSTDQVAECWPSWMETQEIVKIITG